MNQRRRFSAIFARSEAEDGEKNISSLDSLPNDIIIHILRRLPAHFLYNSARFVCKTWAEILQHPSFKNSHLLHSDYGFLIQDGRGPHKAQFVHIKGWKRKVKDLKHKFPGKINGSSDGVLLNNKSSGSVVQLYVANPVTMQGLKLPCLPSNCRLSGHCNSIASISSTAEIKVVSLGRDSNGMYHWYVLTVGKVMSGRKISNSYAPAECELASYLSYVQSLSADGIVYWTNSSWIANHSVLAIDLGDETTHHLKVPTECQGDYWTLVQMGREICCMNCGKNVEMKAWVLKGLHRNEWVMVKSINFSQESPLRKNFSMPLIWLNCEVLILSIFVQASNAVVAFNVNKGECKVIKIDDVARHPIFQVHHHPNTILKCAYLEGLLVTSLNSTSIL